MSTAQAKAFQKQDYEILFKDSPEYYVVQNAKMFNEGPMVRFICFDDTNVYRATEWYPVANIHRIRAYAN